MKRKIQNSDFFKSVIDLVRLSKSNVVRHVNKAMVTTYFEIGRMIVEQQQGGQKRAEYGERLLEGLSGELTKEFGKGFSAVNLENMRKFYLVYSISSTVSRKSDSTDGKPQTVSRKLESGELIRFELSWSHYQKLMRIEDAGERKFYEIEALENNWSIRELQRQYDSALYQRLALSKDKKKVKILSEKGQQMESPKDAVKEPYILEFLGLEEHSYYSESQLEQKIIEKLEHFLLELGKGFAFIARQKRISFEEDHFYIDLVFYNRILNCFVLIDLKIGKLKHQDIGQMQMYVNYFDRFEKEENENKFN